MSARGRADRQFRAPSTALLALLVVLQANPIFAVLAATRPIDALAIAILAVATVALLSDLTLGVCIFVAVQFALPNSRSAPSPSSSGSRSSCAG